MQFEITHTPEFFKTYCLQYFEAGWAKSRRETKKLLYITIIAFLLGIVIALGKSNDSYIAFALTFFIGTYWWVYYRMYVNAKKRIVIAIEKKIKKKAIGQQPETVGFTDEYFQLTSNEADFKLHWTAFEHYMIINDVLYIISDVGIAFMVGKSQAEAGQYSALLGMVKNKLSLKV